MPVISKSTRVASRAVAIALIVLAGTAVADPVELMTSLTTEYSDNIRRTADKESDVIYTANVGASYHDREGIFDNTFNALLGFETYQDKTFGDDITANLDWAGLLHIIPSRFIWSIQDSLKDTRRTSLRPFTPDNRQRQNVFSTGPTYFLPIGTADTLRFSSQYSRTDNEEDTSGDSYRYSGGFGWSHLMPSFLKVDWNNSVETVVFDTDSELFNKSTSLELSKKHEFFDWRAQAGYAETESDQLGSKSTFDGFEGEAQLRYQVNSDSQLRLFASQQLTDTSSQFAILIFNTPLTFNVQQVVKLTIYELGYDYDITPRDSVNTSLARRVQDYQTTNQSEETNSAKAQWNHQFSTTLSGYVYATGEQQRFSELNRTDKEGEIGVGVRSNLYRNLELEGFTAYRKHLSDGDEFDYNELRIGAKLVYYPSIY